MANDKPAMLARIADLFVPRSMGSYCWFYRGAAFFAASGAVAGAILPKAEHFATAATVFVWFVTVIALYATHDK